jgi:hypothetical protein
MIRFPARSAVRSLFVLSLFATATGPAGCRVDSPLGTEASGAAGASGTGGVPSTTGAGGAAGDATIGTFSVQPSSIMRGDGTYVCAASPANPYLGCPATIADAAQGQFCAAPLGYVCDYQSPTGWQSCSCLATADGLRWSCAGASAGYDCPLERPAHGSACGPNDYGRTCSFLRSLACTCPADTNAAERRSITCTCDNTAHAWECQNGGRAGAPGSDAAGGSGGAGGVGGLAGFDESPCYGTGTTLPTPPLDETKIISALTDDEVTAWCRWYVETNRAGGPPPPMTPPAYDAQGFPTGYGFTYCGSGGESSSACFSTVPVAYCQKLMRLGPCDAPLKALDDCYLTMVNRCEEVGGGCAVLGSHPSCRQTVVQLGPQVPGSTSCPVPVK